MSAFAVVVDLVIRVTSESLKLAFGGACRHAPECLQYLQKLRDPQIFRFCAIPQVMAMGTLALCYNNPKVFTGMLYSCLFCISFCRFRYATTLVCCTATGRL